MSNFFHSLTRGDDETHAHYAQGVNTRGALVDMTCDDDRNSDVAALLKQHGAQQVEGKSTGSNTLGVARHVQNLSVGMALTAGAMEHLRDRRCSSCYIQWTGLADWYGKLAAKAWAYYHMASKKL